MSGLSQNGPTTGRAPVGAPAPTAANLTTTSDDGWWLWWEYAKLEFLVPNRLTLVDRQVTKRRVCRPVA